MRIWRAIVLAVVGGFVFWTLIPANGVYGLFRQPPTGSFVNQPDCDNTRKWIQASLPTPTPGGTPGPLQMLVAPGCMPLFENGN